MLDSMVGQLIRNGTLLYGLVKSEVFWASAPGFYMSFKRYRLQSELSVK